ncbi:hypothetical protein CEXT_433011 [Caerostris extrusa]|uniref:Uncharacterized protein n=1 Tax=Caerostris extrusa TaxID=172846 RepID=A0AAV4SAN6_CAEEX|nr:hypothetical protein CEXT_433011 [Caerostris extrusa]
MEREMLKSILEGFGLSNISPETGAKPWISVCNQMRIVTRCRLRWVTNETSDYESPIPFKQPFVPFTYIHHAASQMHLMAGPIAD